MTIKALVTPLILCLVSLSVNSELWAAEIVGKITDVHTGQAIASAIVRAIPQQRNRREAQAETDRNGRYKLELLKGRYKLFVSVPNSNYMPRHFSASGQAQGDIFEVPTFESFKIIDATLESGGSISGNVRRWIDGGAIAGVRVYAEGGGRRYSTNTREDGRYVFRALPPGRYKIHALTLDESYVPVYYDGAFDPNQAQWVYLDRQQEITGISFRLQYGGTISGRVYARKNREPIVGVKVIAERENSAEPPLFTYTDVQGFYSIRGLTDGLYTVETGTLRDSNVRSSLENKYLLQYFDGRFDLELATKLEIESGASIRGVDFSLVEGGRIAGKAISRYDRSPLADVEILPQHTNKEILNPPTGKTDFGGFYSIASLPPGDYVLDTSLPKQSRGFIEIFFRDKLTIERADRITVGENAFVRDIDFNFALGAAVRGKVKVDEPEYKFSPAGDVVMLKRVGIDLEGFGERNFRLSVDGSFTIEGTPPGRYSLTPKILDPNVLLQSDQGAKTVDVVEGETLEGVDFNLKVGGSLAGTVSSQDSFYTVDKLLLILISVEKNTKTYFDLSSENYTIAGINPGRYVLVLLSNPDKTHPGRDFQPSRVFDTRLVEVSKGKTTRGVSFQIASSEQNQPVLSR